MQQKVWAGVTSRYLELLDKLQKRIWRTVGSSFVASLKPLAHFQNEASLSLFFGYFLVDVLQNWLKWFHFLFPVGGLLVILTDCMIFLSPFLDVTKMSMSSFFPHTAKLWDSLPIECFPLTYNLSGFKPRINRHLLTVGPL